MPIHLAAGLLQHVDTSVLVGCAGAALAAYTARTWVGGRRCTWEREWAGKLIMIVAPPTPTTLALITHLLHLPSPPQILYLPPYASPLPPYLVTLIQTIQLELTNPLASISVEPLPPTPSGVRDFVRQWSAAPYGTAGEGGRRVDAIVLGGAWDVSLDRAFFVAPALGGDVKAERPWTPEQFHVHLVTSLLPALLRAPPERSIRIISLLNRAFAAAVPELTGHARPTGTPLGLAARRAVTAALVVAQLRLVLDTLAAATYGKKEVVPDPIAGHVRKRDTSVQSNIVSLGVVMPWARHEVVAALIPSTLLYILLYPFLLFLTPSPSRSIQSILFALSAPVRYADGPTSPRNGPKVISSPSAPPTSSAGHSDALPADAAPRRADDADAAQASIGQGDVVRNCAVFDIPPILRDPALARETWDRLEKEVEAGVKANQAREKALGVGAAAAAAGDPKA
ncbi:hypothetical protein Q5752_005171 [Cryptotrichosporon argae]